MGRRWDCIHRRKNICPKQQETQEKDSTRKSQLGGCGISRTAKDARIDQIELLVARIKRRHQEICTRMFQMLTEQSSELEEVRRVISIGHSTGTIARDQYQYHWTFT